MTPLHIFLDVASKLAFFSLVFLLGFAVEQIRPVERVFDGPGLIRNYVVGYFFLFGQEMALIGFGFVMVHSGHALFSLGNDRSLWKAVGPAFVWLFARDFFYYWFHRLQHSSKWLWAQHALHHSDEHVNATTTVRHHWLEMPLTAIFVYVPLSILFEPPVLTYGLVAAAVSWLGLTNHMNIRIGFGRFGWLISSPQNHRIHHSTRPEHLDKNFAAYFPIWDVLFGTYYKPARTEYPSTGLSSGERVTTAWQALTLPFTTWRKMISERIPPGRPKRSRQALHGHSDLATTLAVYTHAIPDSQKRAVERVAGLLELDGPDSVRDTIPRGPVN